MRSQRINYLIFNDCQKLSPVDKPETFNQYVNDACRLSDSLMDNEIGRFGPKI